MKQHEIHITNSLTKKKELFTSVEKNIAKVYHCGPTVYWTQHIGNSRAMLVADITHRTLKFAGYDVKFVRNYTDVGHLSGDNEGDADTGIDRMEKGVKREGLTPDQIADKYIKLFNDDLISLNTLFDEVKHVRATHHIQEMIDLIQALLEKGFAYTTDLAIYFDISKAKDYTSLSGQDISKLISGSGFGSIDDTSNKRNTGDFSLWFFKAGSHANALQTWESPFVSPLVENGKGFPGWHIECSAMSMCHLGETLDIHLGGVEHIPIHHTNEIAQSESATGKTFTNYWMHNEHLLIDGGKMSKSEGKVAYITDIIERGIDPLALRYFFMQAHYRSKQNFTWEALEASATALLRLQKAVAKIKKEAQEVAPNQNIQNEFLTAFENALFDDFNTPQALAQLNGLVKSDLSADEKYATILKMNEVLGLNLDLVSTNKLAEDLTSDIPDTVLELLEKRKTARAEKSWGLSDELRDQIKELGYEVLDGSDGQEVVKI